MKPIVKKIGIFFFALLALCLLLLFMVASVFEKQVGNLVLKGLNDRLTTELSVGEFDLTLIPSFPNGVIRLKEVTLPGAYEEAGILLEAKSVSLSFGLASLLSKQYKVKSVEIDDGALVLYQDKSGRPSYDVLVTSEDSEDLSFDISLKEAKLKNIELIYSDMQKKTEAFWNVEEIGIAGEFSDKRFAMTSYSEIQSAFLELPEGRYLVNKPLAYDAVIAVDLEKGTYSFDNVEVVLDANKFKVKGEVLSKDDITDFDLDIEGIDCSIQSVRSILPEAYQDYLGEFSSRGNFFFLGSIVGEYGPNSNPLIEAEFGLERGRITSPDLDYSLKDVTFSGRFHNGKENRSTAASVFEIPDFKGKLKNQPVSFSLTVEDIDDPEIDLNFTGILPLAGCHGLIGSPLITDGSGTIIVDSLQVKGAYKHMISQSSMYKVNTSGKLEFKDASLKFNGKNMNVESGIVYVSDNNLEVEALKVNGASSRLELSGVASNFLPVLLADSLNTNNAVLDFSAFLTAEKLDFDKLEELFALPVTEKEVGEVVFDSLKEAKIINRERITKLLSGTFEMVVDEFNYNKIEGEEFTADLDFESNLLNIKELKAKAMDGDMEVTGKVFFEEEPRSEVVADFNAINIRDFFYQFENFGQKTLTDRHIKGKLDTRMLVKSYWDKEGYFLPEKLYVLSDAVIKDGELLDFEMLESFSKFVKVRDLNHVKFTELRNQIEISNGAIYLPTMFLQSNAMNLIVSGKQRFDNRMRYMIKVNAGQVLWNKIKRYNPSMKPKKAKKKGFINVYLVIDGTVDNYDYTRGKKNYNHLLGNLRGKFEGIRSDVAKILNVEKAIELEDWEDDPTSPDVDDEPFNPDLDKEIDF
ncbi:MAG: AsmA-like C-terminal region-containing protein [Bacteroidota bacterium]